MRFLCSLEKCEENKPVGIALGDRDDIQDLFLIRRDGIVYAYLNRCPHTGASLNWLPDQFLDLEANYIQCSIHGALFRIQDGFCVWGPCVNQSLEAVPVHIENEQIFLATTD